MYGIKLRFRYAIPVNGNRYKAYGKLDDRATIRRANWLSCSQVLAQRGLGDRVTGACN